MYTTPYLPEIYSKLSDTNHKEYQARFIEDYWRLEEDLGYHPQEETDSDDNWEGEDEEEVMTITPAALKALCSSTLSPLHQYDTVQIRSVKRSIINGLMRVTYETHDH